MTVSSEWRKVAVVRQARRVRALCVQAPPAGGRAPDADAGRASRPFCHVDICTFMPIADLIDSAFESMVATRPAAVRRHVFTRVILTFYLYPDKNNDIPIPACGRPR
ncbi:hypothetical protein [Burkholderia pyrrocinia]|uniref:hypothetical protein n=1 Tax=Burkholderia pyrrocinia TaxID=60550 RepID=UPI001588DF94|nr:hypothetical protein [Burkholderia pyrrocinia]